MSRGISRRRGVRIPLRQGRWFEEGEDGLVLSEQMAARLFPGQNAVGRHVVLSGEKTLEVKGVAGNVRNGGLTANSDPEIYLLSGRGQLRQYILVRGDGRAMPFVRGAVAEVDPRLLVQMETLEERVRTMRARPLFQSTLLGGFAIAGLLLAAIGLYGVVALLIAQRTGEIGIRMALGATAADIRRMVLGQAGVWTAMGVVLGLGAAAAGAKVLEGMLYEVKPGAPGPVIGSVVVLAGTALLAAYVPARRAARIMPLEALRQE